VFVFGFFVALIAAFVIYNRLEERIRKLEERVSFLEDRSPQAKHVRDLEDEHRGWK